MNQSHIEQDKIPKLRGEYSKIYMELNEVSFRLKDVQYRQERCRRIYIFCLVIVAILFLASLLIWSKDLFYERRPVTDFHRFIIVTLTIIEIVIGCISSVIFFSAMSVYTFWVKCANFFRIEKLEMQRLYYAREKHALTERMKELEIEITAFEKDDLGNL